MAKGLLFSGQGAQRVGMAHSLHANALVARELFAEANETLGFDLQHACFEGPEAYLTETRVCQPALYVHGMILFRLLRERGMLGDWQAALGLSLGELTAYAAAGVWALRTGLRVVAERGRLMQEACEATEGTMGVLIGGDRDSAFSLAREFDVDVANLNCPGQTVLSGAREPVEAAMAVAREHGFKLGKTLPVAGAYHSRLMEPARARFEAFLAEVPFNKPAVTVFTNTSGRAVSEPDALRAALVKQVVSPVYWEDCLRGAAGIGVTDYYECGPDPALAGMAKRIDRNIKVISISEWGDIPE